MNKFSNLLKTFLFLLRGYFSFVIPKKKNLYVFLPSAYRNEFTGNIKAFCNYLISSKSKKEVIVLSPNKALLYQVEKLGINNRNYYSIGGLWQILRAEFIFIDGNRLDFGYGNFSIIQLWHGVGFKNVALLNDNPGEGAKRKLLIKNYNKYKLLIATSDCNRIQQNQSFGINCSVVTGYPRNDIFISGHEFSKKILEKYDLIGYKKIITYAPTFRDKNTHRPFSKFFWEDLNSYLIKENALFIVKKHPNDLFLKIPNSFSTIIEMKDIDIQNLLLITDVLITDYSSVSTDFCITGRPILIYAYDYEKYRSSCRSMYFNFEEILPRPFIKNETDLLEMLKDMSWFQDSAVRKSYKKFSETFHKYIDGESSKRVLEQINLISKYRIK